MLRRLVDDLRYGVGALAEDLSGTASVAAGLVSAGALAFGLSDWARSAPERTQPAQPISAAVPVTAVFTDDPLAVTRLRCRARGHGCPPPPQAPPLPPCATLPDVES